MVDNYAVTDVEAGYVAGRDELRGHRAIGRRRRRVAAGWLWTKMTLAARSAGARRTFAVADQRGEIVGVAGLEVCPWSDDLGGGRRGVRGHDVDGGVSGGVSGVGDCHRAIHLLTLTGRVRHSIIRICG